MPDMGPHITHHDDCGCLSERFKAELAERDKAIRLLRDRLFVGLLMTRRAK